jgi:hypothetical protein
VTEVKKITTTQYATAGKVDIDGNIWDVIVPGAGTELKMSKYQRQIKLIQKKLDNDTATEEDIEKYDQMEEWFFEFFKSIFSDGTPENKSVKEWIDRTPTAVIFKVVEDLLKQADQK